MTTNLRVVPPGMHKGAILVALALGPIAAGCLFLYASHADRIRPSAPGAAFWVGVLIVGGFLCLLSVPMLWVVLLCATSQRWKTMAAAAATGYSAMALTFITIIMLEEFSGVFSSTMGEWLYPLMWLGIAITVATVSALLLRFLTRLFIVRTIEQPGTLCWTCAYDLSATAPGNPCPECGTNLATSRPRRRAIINTVRFANRHVAKAFILIAVVALPLIGWRMATWVYPVLKVRHAVNAVPGIAQAYTDYSNRTRGTPRIVAMAVPIPGHQQLCIVVTDGITADPNDVPMMLAVGHIRADFYFQGNPADEPPVNVTLTPDQTRHVRRYGIPPELIAAMNQQWQAARAEYDDLLSQGEDTSHLESKYAIDPAPFFLPSPR